MPWERKTPALTLFCIMSEWPTEAGCRNEFMVICSMLPTPRQKAKPMRCRSADASLSVGMTACTFNMRYNLGNYTQCGVVQWKARCEPGKRLPLQKLWKFVEIWKLMYLTAIRCHTFIAFYIFLSLTIVEVSSWLKKVQLMVQILSIEFILWHPFF